MPRALGIKNTLFKRAACVLSGEARGAKSKGDSQLTRYCRSTLIFFPCTLRGMVDGGCGRGGLEERGRRGSFD